MPQTVGNRSSSRSPQRPLEVDASGLTVRDNGSMSTRTVHLPATRKEAVERVAAGESRRAVARALGVSDATVGRWCNIAADGKLDDVACTHADAAQKGWVSRRADIAASWEYLATECQALALQALRIDAIAADSRQNPVLDKLRLLGGSSPLKAILTSAAIATDKALLMSNEVTSRTAAHIDNRISTVSPGFSNLERIVSEQGPCVDDPEMDRLFDEMERHLLGG